MAGRKGRSGVGSRNGGAKESAEVACFLSFRPRLIHLSIMMGRRGGVTSELSSFLSRHFRFTFQECPIAAAHGLAMLFYMERDEWHDPAFRALLPLFYNANYHRFALGCVAEVQRLVSSGTSPLKFG